MADYIDAAGDFISQYREPIAAAALVSAAFGLYLLKKRYTKNRQLQLLEAHSQTSQQPTQEQEQRRAEIEAKYRPERKRSSMMDQPGRERFRPGYVPPQQTSENAYEGPQTKDVSLYAEIKEGLMQDNVPKEK